MQSVDRAPSKGFFTIAQNSGETDYVRMAYALALSLRCSQKTVKNLSIGITPGTKIDQKYAWAFDNIIEIPWNDHAADSSWKLENEWKTYHMSPYDETVKLDCDMLFFNDIAAWWDAMSGHDFLACNQVLDYRSMPIANDYYRKTFTDSQLPNIYTGFMYFKKTAAAAEVFELAQHIYFDWLAFFEWFLLPETRPTFVSTDVVFALAAKILDLDQIHNSPRTYPTFVHMKSRLQGWGDHVLEDWRQHARVFFNPDLQVKLGNYLQWFPLHYHLKDFITDEMLGYYEQHI